MNDFDKLEDRFYGVRVKSHEVEPGVWIVRGLVIRKDTDEPVGGTQIRSSDTERALRQLKKSLKPIVAALARPPYEWGVTSVRLILVAYKAFNEKLTAVYVALEEKRALGSLSKDELNKAHHVVLDMVRRQTIELVEKLEKLTETEKLQLMTSSEDVYQHIHGPWSLDDVYARDAIFDYILQPSAELIKRHEAHQARIVAEFKRNGPE